MRHEIKIKDCHLEGTSDLTVLAKIKSGFVPGLDAVTYKTRVKRVLRTLHAGRRNAHEFELARMLSDAVERVGRIHAVRIAVLEPEDKVLLAVTFDGAWESYVRVIWQKVARLLDLIFCNTEGYEHGWTSTYEKWVAWLRSAQAETSFLYAIPGLTVGDTQYLRTHERLQRSGQASELELAQHAVQSAEEVALGLFNSGQDPTTLPPSLPLPGLTDARAAMFRQGMRSLVGLYRLTDLYPPNAGTQDDPVLQRAARELLPEFARLVQGPDLLSRAVAFARRRFAEQLDWFIAADSLPPSRQPPALPDGPDPDVVGQIQGGILTPYANVDHGVLLLVSFKTPQALADLLEHLPATRGDATPQPGGYVWNLHFSLEGLRMAGVSDADIEGLPAEFVQGMERRAGLLGDVRVNDPGRWRLPARNWAQGAAAAEPGDGHDDERLRDLREVHAVIQLRHVQHDGAQVPAPVVRQALFAELQKLANLVGDDMLPLSVQWMQRLRNQQGDVVEHFGFRDGNSDPVLQRQQAGLIYPNHVHVGEALIGRPNAVDAAPALPSALPWMRSVLQDGSFLVVRKLRQDIGLLEDIVHKTLQADAGQPAALTREQLLGKMMGRWPDSAAKAGEPLAGLLPHARSANDFDYQRDGTGSLCPFHAHVRRANPRSVPVDGVPSETAAGARPPRLFRRSLSYGDPPKNGQLEGERGLIFMAYNASIGEQFEVVQGWIARGNSAGGYSCPGDPFLAVAEPGRPRVFQFEHQADPQVPPRMIRVRLDGNEDLLGDPRPLVRLEWGGYFFTPSLAGLGLLQQRARQVQAAAAREPLGWSVEAGEAKIKALQALELEQGAMVAKLAWKAALEDPEAAGDFTTASLWAAIRARHGGVLRTPYGVLVADRDQVEGVLLNREQALTSTGYLPRMQKSFGPIYLGLDAGQEDRRYEEESKACNDAIMALAGSGVFDEAERVVHDKLDQLVRDAQDHAVEDEVLRRASGGPARRWRWELTVDVRELIDELLAHFCEKWFGLDAAWDPVQRSGFRWTWREGEPPCYPGHFMAPSRYVFQPHPGATVESRGASHGRAMRDAMEKVIAQRGASIQAPVTRAVLDAVPGVRDYAFAARTLVGAMMGMVPTVDANLRRVMDRWIGEGTLWRLQSALRSESKETFRAAVEQAFLATMQSRPAPDTLWRTAWRSVSLGTAQEHRVNVVPGELVVAGLSSVAQQAMEAGGAPEVSIAFGGDRTAANHPTHACPGYRPALLMMQGFVAALLRPSLPWRMGPGPLTLTVDGYLDPSSQPQPLTVGSAWAALGAVEKAASLNAERVPPAAFVKDFLLTPNPAVWTHGDSWVADLLHLMPNLVTALQGRGFRIEIGEAAVGYSLERMASNLAHTCAKLLKKNKGEVGAVLVSGGGNDVVNEGRPRASPLYGLLHDGATTLAEALDAEAVNAFIDQTLRGHYVTLLSGLLEATKHLDVPIIIHGYGHPVPDGRWAEADLPPPLPRPRLSGPWLKEVFDLRRIDDLRLRTDVMKTLIDRLNQAIGAVVSKLSDERLRYVDLRSQLSNDLLNDKYKEDWDNELHLTAEGYGKAAAHIVPHLQEAGPMSALALSLADGAAAEVKQ